jgi:hypothetical protein
MFAGRVSLLESEDTAAVGVKRAMPECPVKG